MKKFFVVLILAVMTIGGFAPFSASLAQSAKAVLFVSPSAGSFAVGKTFSVKVAVNSGGGTGINAAEGSLKFDNSALSVAGVSESGSIFKLWTTNPTFSNSAGAINFGGGSPGPYTGNSGTIFTITFTAKKAGEAQVDFSSGIVLAADGKGTNVFGGFGNAKFTITEAAKAEEKPQVKPEEKTETAKGLLPPLPEIISDTHPETAKWYQNNHPQFSWKLLADLVGVSYDINDKPNADPGAEIDGIVENVDFDEAVPDGEKYFHIKYKNKSGWGQIAHRRVLIDATPPQSFAIFVENGNDSTNPAPFLRFKTSDAVSGLDYYMFAVGGKADKLDAATVNDGHVLQPMAPGKYTASIQAVDRAGNISSSTVDFSIDPLKAPIITSIPKTVNSKEEMIIRGTSFYPRVTIRLFIMMSGKDPIEASVTTDDEGNWSYFHTAEMPKGVYEVWAKLIDERGAQSSDSTKYLVTVNSLSLLSQFGLWIILFLLAIIVVLIMYISYQKKEFAEEEQRIMRETEEVKSKLSKIFQALREEVDELVQMSDKKPGFSESERRVKEKLDESLDISEEFISKEVTDVEKEIRVPKKKG